MKKFIILIVIVLGMITTSCSRDRYSYDEMKTFIAIGSAALTEDSIEIITDSEVTKYPIILFNQMGYYPVMSSDGYVYYYAAYK